MLKSKNINLHLLWLLVPIFISCKNDYNDANKSYQFIPDRFDKVIKIRSLNDYITLASNNDMLNALGIAALGDSIKILNYLEPKQDLFIALNKTDSITEYIILTENHSTLFDADSIANIKLGKLKGSTITQIQIDESQNYQKLIGNTFIVASSLELCNQITAKNENEKLIKLIETANKESSASLIFNNKSSPFQKLEFADIILDEKNLNYSVLDLTFDDQNLQYSGILKPSDTTQNFIDCFKNTAPQSNYSLEIVPQTIESLTSYTFDNYSVFNNNLRQQKGIEKDSSTTFLNYVNEVTLIKEESKSAILTHALDINLALESIDDNSLLETYRDINIYTFKSSNYFKDRLTPFITYDNTSHMAVLNEFMIFSDSLDYIKTIIVNALNNTTLANTEAFKAVSSDLTNESSILTYKNSKLLSQIFDKPLDGYQTNVVQITYENNYAHVNGISQKFKKANAINSVEEIFSTSLGTDILNAPQTVKNHLNNSYDIAVQDVNNVLYLISNSGNVLWKKQLNGEILGKIEQIDMYKNGRLQMAFATPKRLYVLDRNGKDVKPFPLQFKDNISQPLSIFDYNNSKAYRLLITQNKSLLMYDVKGKIISGFDYNASIGNIKTQPKHFRLSNKDYIVFIAGDKFKILNRRGQDRINVKDNIKFSGNEIYLYQNRFTTTNTLGQLVQVNIKSNVTVKTLNLSENHFIETTSKTLVSLNENRLHIKSNEIDLDFGEYTPPKIFYLNDKIYVTTTDLQSKKVYIFDSQSKLLPNFPVYGNSSIEMVNISKKGSVNFVVKGETNSIIYYRIN